MREEPKPTGSAHTVFRGINERLYGLDSSLGTSAPEILLVCECSRQHCFERIVVLTERYEQLRADADTAIVLVGHPADGERAGDGADVYEIVQLQPR